MRKCSKCFQKSNHLYKAGGFGNNICGICYINGIRTFVIEMGIKLGCDCGCDGDFWEKRMKQIRKEVKGE